MSRQTNSGDVTSWLSGLQLFGAQEEDDVGSFRGSDVSYDFVNPASPPCTSEGSSIEIVSSHYDSEKDDCSTPRSGICEIENLHLHVNNKSQWLSGSYKTPCSPQSQKIDIASACQANETCSSFSDCLCRNSCQQSALEKLQQTADYQVKSGLKRALSDPELSHPILAHIAKIFASDNSSWLVKNRGDRVDLPRPVRRAMYEAPADKWLRTRPSAMKEQVPSIRLETHSNIWLLRHFKSQKDNKSQEKDEKDVENDRDEKETSITTEALSEALKKVDIGSSFGVQSGMKLSSADTLGRNNASCDDLYWLLSKKAISAGQEIRDNKLEEMETGSKKQWLITTSETGSPPMLGSEGSPASHLSEALFLPVAQASLQSWLIKSYS